MAIRLTLISADPALTREQLSREFGPAGGRIGRAADNDWVLPDPERYLSAHHARLQCHRGEYFIEDTSTNGVYMNGSVEPLGRTGPQQLREGDTLQMGGYQMQVRLAADALAAPAPDASAVVSCAVPPSRETDDSIDAGFDVEALLGGALPPLTATSGPLPASAAESTGTITTVPSSDTPLRATREAPREPPRAETRAEVRALEPRADAAVSDGAMAAFCRGAGIDPASVSQESRSRFLQVAGMVLREALLGVKQLDAAQRRIRHEHGLAPLANDSTLAGMASLQIEDLLLKLLAGHHRQKLDAVQWLRELYAAARGQDAALLGALRPAMAEFLTQLEKTLPPKQLDSIKRFRSLTDMPDGQLPRQLGEALSRAFATEIQRLVRAG